VIAFVGHLGGHEEVLLLSFVFNVAVVVADDVAVLDVAVDDIEPLLIPLILPLLILFMLYGVVCIRVFMTSNGFVTNAETHAAMPAATTLCVNDGGDCSCKTDGDVVDAFDSLIPSSLAITLYVNFISSIVHRRLLFIIVLVRNLIINDERESKKDSLR
jgi:hypothetical protein